MTETTIETEHDDDPHGVLLRPERTDEEVTADLDALVADRASAAPVDYLPPLADAPYRASASRLPDPPVWDIDAASRPKSYAKSLATLQPAADRANALVAALGELDADEREAKGALQREAVAAGREGREVKIPAARDFARERLILQAQHRDAKATYDALRIAHRKVTEDVRGQWLAALQRRCTALLTEAREARGAAPVGEWVGVVKHWADVVNATHTLWQHLNPTIEAPILTGHAVVADLARAAYAVQEFLASDDDMVTGQWMDPKIQPPLLTRKRWAESGGGALEELLRIEKAESWAVSDYSLPYAMATGRAGEVTTTPSGQRFVAAPQVWGA